jgi:cell division transport system ATP-binding protein
VIRFDHVTKFSEYLDRIILDDLTFELDKGELAFLIGPSGSGKSTVLRLTARLHRLSDRPDFGKVFVDGRNVARLRRSRIREHHARSGYVPQRDDLRPLRTPWQECVEYMRDLRKSRRTIERSVEAVLDLVGLGNQMDWLIASLSAGQRAQLMLARSIVNRPLILLLDNPTGNLDPDTSIGIMSVIERINRTGTTILMATTDTNVVDAMRRRVIELARGRLVRDQSRGVYGVGR